MRTFNLLLTSLLLGAATTASAHSLWTLGENKEVFEADILYGHDFPHPEKIPAKRLSLFEPLKVVSRDGTVVLTQSGENYHYKHTAKLGKGTHILVANYKPTYWTEKTNGEWEMGKTRRDVAQAKECGLYSMQGKSFVVIDDDAAFSTQPLAQGYEITPLVPLNGLKANETAKFKVTHNGKPVEGVKVVGAPAGFDTDDLDIHAFSATTDDKGEFSFKALTSGPWYLASEVEIQGKDPKVCDKEVHEFTLSFAVK